MASLLESVFNHVVLPPKLPGCRDSNGRAVEDNLLARLLGACEALSTLPGQGAQSCWEFVRQQLLICLDLHRCRLDRASIRRAFSNLSVDCPLVLYIEEQNCAILVRLLPSDGGDDNVVFETFEGSPSSEAVLAAEGALQWDFPGRAARIPLAVFSNPSFTETLATFLEQASTEALDRFAARSRKAGASISETRDSVNPALISQMLLPLLEAIGSSVHVPMLRKRVRDDVNLDRAELPWRRLPYWLVLRVAVQRHLCLVLGNNKGRPCYKFLICTLLSQLLTDCASQLAPELTVLLRSKLCRRLAKLEMEMAEASPEHRAVYRRLFESISPSIRGAVRAAMSHVEARWHRYRAEITPSIPRLPLRADGESLRLSLNNSAAYLDSLLQSAASRKRKGVPEGTVELESGTGSDPMQQFILQCFELSRLEMDIRQDRILSRTDGQCSRLALRITDFVHDTGGAFDTGPEQASVSILSIFDLWVKLDEGVVAKFPLLLDYHPGFSPELLDILQLAKVQDMERLRRIQGHLRDRCQRCRFGSKTIMSGLSGECFAARFMAESTDLQSLQRQIEAESHKARVEAESRWRKAYDEYDALTMRLDEISCTCLKMPNGAYGARNCERCRCRRKRKKLRVNVHEDFLPSESWAIAAVVLELGMPGCLAAYRDATWIIMSRLAHPSRSGAPSATPHMRLTNYGPLKRFVKSEKRILSVASAKKSFLQSHYRQIKMKADRSAVLLPYSLDFRLYDAKSETWVGDLRKPLTFSHLCGVRIPAALQGSVFPLDAHPHHDPDGPSSYQAIANQARCPVNMSKHELLSYQRLLSGRARRWLTLLSELGSPHLNFNCEDTMHLISQLAVQAGPARQHQDTLGDVHVVFRDVSFCACLAEQIERRLGTIRTNWREVYCMEMLITMSLRLLWLAGPDGRSAAEVLLRAAREVTLGWVARTHEQRWHCAESGVGETAAKYCLWASLLCRRTFVVLEHARVDMSAKELEDFVQASVALRQNLELSPALRSMLVRDMKMAHAVQDAVKSAIQQHPAGLDRAIASIWADGADQGLAAELRCGEWEFLPSHAGPWVTCMASPINVLDAAQRLHYNFVDGRLLVDGSLVSKPPLDISNSAHVKELFGDQYLLTFPSPRLGMSHMVARRQGQYRIHLGHRNGRVVIQAVNRGKVLEYVPSAVFSGTDTCDLPLGLVRDCVHWLDLGSGRLEIRRKPHVWRTRGSDWILEVRKRRAYLGRNKASLVGPHSHLAQMVAGILGGFEDSRKLVIFQPLRPNGTLSVELRNLGLSFLVNDKGLLECREVGAEVDPDQDAGTLYGFRSGLVLRAVGAGGERSILVPLGAVSWSREGIHVSVRMGSADHYGRFGIDQVLGQLTCPPEPELLYAKALLHALTSFALPDSLTRRTGAEESLRTLESGRGQPWQPLGDGAKKSLAVLRELTPQRNYYPPDRRRFQTARWDGSLTVAVQHESYRPVVSGILERSEQLRAFADSAGGTSASLEAHREPPASWLHRRAERQRLCYERATSRRAELGPAARELSSTYQPRDRELTLPEATRVYRLAESFLCRPREIHMAGSLSASLQRWQRIGGFHEGQEGNAVLPLADLVSSNIAEQWGSLVDTFRSTDRGRPYEALFKLALLAFSPEPDTDVLRFFAACHHLDELRALQPPRHPLFADFESGETPTLPSLQRVVSATFDESDFATTVPVRYTSRGAVYTFEGDQEERLSQCRQEADSFAAFILQQWPSPEPSAGGFGAQELDVTRAMGAVLPEWRRMYRNLRLSEYSDAVQHILDNYPGKPDESTPASWDPGAHEPFSLTRSGGPAVPLLVRDACFHISDPAAGAPPTQACHNKGPSLRPRNPAQRVERMRREVAAGTSRPRRREVDELGAILSRFTTSPDGTRRDYGNSLRSSLAALESASGRAEENGGDDRVPDLAVVEAQISDALSSVEGQRETVTAAFSSGDPRFRWLGLADLWPWTSAGALLELLRSSNAHPLGLPARKLLVSYGLSVARLQRLRRIRSAQQQGDTARAAAEWQNVGHASWSPLDLPDWLLLEIDSNLLIRPEQVEVAHAILYPASGSNSVLQMNMGCGKTSCIVPMAMSVLADGVQLARLIVPRALLSQTAQAMQARLGGLVGRDIIHVPFSRRTPKAPAIIPLYSGLHERARLRRGIVLAAPEHVLSYKLGGLQRLADSLLDEAREMIAFQARLSETCRDVLDESDYTLGVKTQLIYPSGPQLPLDGQPHRWVVVQGLLLLAEDHLPGIQKDFPQSLELSERRGRFPVAHFLQADAEDELMRRIARDVSSGRTVVLARASPAQGLPSALVQGMLLSDRADPGLVELVARQFPNAKAASDSILLVHGLLRKRILTTCLKKRWNVQYGFHPARHPVAVPFDAKGVPSEQSEFGHPDVALVLTCLSFYYAGITATQFRQSLQCVLRSDDPVAEYDKWTQGLDGVVPGHLSHCNAISLDNQEQVDQLWRIFRLSRTVLNHYMNNFVFPAHARQFDVKMQASGWDLPLVPLLVPLEASLATSPSPRPMSTGFSGTNDNRLLLPLTIKQQDLESLRHTNAEVLTYLLQPRSREYYCVLWRVNREEELMAELSRRRIRVLIDAGAYVLEQDNKSLVKTWLSKDTQAKAAVYFGTDNRPWVQYRNGKKALLISTPFAEALDECLVYLDEAHTRGVDLRLPRNARGALTLALGQTKDHTVQAAMRLRALGSTQAVVFFAPPEVHQSIVDTCKLPRGQSVDSSHVVTWLLEQTCHANEQLRGLHLAQGYDFCRRAGAQLRYSNFLEDEADRAKLLSVIRRPERQTLVTLYGAETAAGRPSSPPVAGSFPPGKLCELMLELNREQEMSSGDKGHNSVLEEVEQEREVEFQAEQVRQTQERPTYEALRFPGLHPAIRRFVETGNLSGELGYQHAFSAMASTRIGREYGAPPAKESRLFVSGEYMRTITLRDGSDIDDFLRPVEWILLNPTSQIALIVVPEEAELLIPMLRETTSSKRGALTHLITYVLPLSRDMSNFDGLLHSLPPLPAGHQVSGRLWMELDIFAGRLYAGFDKCTNLRRYMESPDGAAMSANPAGFLLEWLALRHKGQDITHTPMAYVCQGWPLREDHHLFAVQEGQFPVNLDPVVESTGSGGIWDSDRDSSSDDEFTFGSGG
ncbi:hypothetical protein B0T25DRAFT_632188 [Lasiosphaeria hispida]|uniref:ubiquitinyl hydrolase 1 n=1 Tax=Lasiosphaeria hispida TaxID=260671 RepID=A0AAJ0HJF8_9PEZI|nr:hypothetical protein B0T25DRAFT_632188 [Lasiosphaeria hispida]